MNPDTASVQAYIDEQRRHGHSDDAIYQSLLAAGWPAATLHELLQGRTASTGLPVYPESAVGSQQPVQPIDPTTGFFSGRISRLGYLLTIVYILALFVIPLILTLLIRNNRIVNILSILMGIVGIVLAFICSISIQIRRWHDLNQSGWLLLVGFIPFINFVALVFYLFVPGTAGANNYGPPYSGSLSPKSLFNIKS